MLMPYATAVYAERIIVAAAVILLVHVPDARSIADAHIAHYAQARNHGRALWPVAADAKTRPRRCRPRCGLMMRISTTAAGWIEPIWDFFVTFCMSPA